MKRNKPNFKPVNGNSFKIIFGEGKAPYKLLWIDENGNETRRTHHKRVDLAYSRAAVWNPDYPIVDETK